jgi:hypothetical protein
MYSNRKMIKSELLRYCQKEHVCCTDGLGADTEYYARCKSFGIPAYVFSREASVVYLALVWRTGAWRKVEGLRQFFISDPRPLCQFCAGTLNTEHFLEICPNFNAIRQKIVRSSSLSNPCSTAHVFDDPVVSLDMMKFLVILTRVVHSMASVEDSEVLKAALTVEYLLEKDLIR